MMQIQRNRKRLWQKGTDPNCAEHPEGGSRNWGLSPFASASKRAGYLAIELLFVLPIIVIMVLAMVEFSMILVARQQLTAASREGARVAAIGGTTADIDNAVHTYLGTGSLAAAQVVPVITDDMNNPLPSGAPVQVTVQIPTAQVVPNLLAPIGFSIANDVLVAQTIMRKE
jgi:Flp pilus assembly protein TadG